MLSAHLVYLSLCRLWRRHWLCRCRCSDWSSYSLWQCFFRVKYILLVQDSMRKLIVEHGLR